MTTIQDYCRGLGWSISDLMRQAGISYQAASKAFYQEPVQARTKRDICRALSSAMEHEIKIVDVQWTEEKED